MNVEAFVDTNVLLYVASKDPADAAKTRRAYELLASVNFGLSLQVVQEFYHNARVKARLGISIEEAERVVGAMLRRPLALTTVELFRRAREACVRHQLRYWDAALLVAAKDLGAKTFYSEDLTHGQDYDGVKVVNPFRSL